MHKISVFVFGTVIAGQVAAQDAGVCYSPGSIAASVLGTLFATLLLVGIGFGIYRYYCKKRRGKHLVLVTDPESAEYAFDNPCFRDGTPVNRTNPENDTSKLDSKAKWYAWSPIGTKLGGKNGRGKALDDSFMTEPRIAVVALKSHDFTGLGFNICGNMRDGIFIKDVLHRGPASESGCISPGDRIDSVRISFRHMVFEDALTILSYASPYDVQLEVENASTSRPSTLIRNKKTATSFGTADRICHPFYRSQSSSDLPQIGKSWRIEGMTVKSVPESRSGGQDDSKAGEYPTLKLSSSPSKPKDENTKSEKMAAPSRVSNDADAGIIKPERIKKINTKGIDSESSEKKHVDEEAGNKIQKFGVRVLPDAGKKEDSKIEKANNPLKNENVVITKVGFESKRSVSPEAELHQNEKNTMIERVSNVPKGNENPKSSPVVAPKGTDEVDSSNNTDNSTKRASTSIFYDERGIDIGPSEQTDSKDIQVKHILTKGLQNLKEKLHYEKKKSTSNSDTGDENPSHSDKKTDTYITANPGNTSHNEEKDEAYEKMISRIPTELPEEVLKAADVARNSRKPSNHSREITSTTPERIRTASENSLSNESIGEDNSAGTGENFDPDAFPKKPYKRKAPPPPEEGKEELSFEIIEKENIKDISNPESDNTDLGKAGKLFTTFANLAKRNNPDKFAKEESDIIIRTTDTSNFGLKRASVGNVGGFESDTLGNDMKNKNLDSLQTSDTNSESDSDMEADQSAGLKNKKVAKGGTTIELNSSHITVHHGPTSDNVVDLENENTRKAASLGDLSRLDTEQPMSILERAVSLDLADGGTPHGTKKRKAPLPPPCDEYLTSPDTDDGTLYKKEPRLEGAMDTFQRRRLKKSSDWGTLEDAIQQSNDLPSFTAPAAVWGKSQTYVSLEEKPNSTETSATESEESKQNYNEEMDNSAEVPHSSSPHDFKYVSYSEANLVKNPLKSSQESINNDQNSHQKTILRISPDINNSNPQVIIKPLTTFQVNDVENVVLPSSTENFTTRVISSTPLNISSSSSILDSSTPIHNHKNLNEFIQSPLITSSNTGVSSICVSSTTHNDLDLSDVDAITAISSVTDPYYTAVDSTSLINDTLEEDLQPPELPSTPMPVLSTSSLPFVPSPSTTYITEIQVVTTGDEDTSLTLNTPVETSDVSSTIVETNHKYRPDSSLSSNSVGSMGDEQDVSLVEKPVTNTMPHKSNVSITAIRGTNNSLGHTERSRIPMRIVTDPTRTTNNVPEEKRLKPNRPPVPPRKSESPSSLLPTVTVQLPSQIINSQPSTSKFITFSSLTPRSSATEDTTVNRNSSFEQWVFLDDKHSGKPNGLENNDDSEIHDKRPHSTVVTLPSALPNRTQSITHIVLDTKSGLGKFA